MYAERNISERQQAVLGAVVELYIASGEPVASQAVAQHLALRGDQVSSATVRNAMADLADAGLLEQPHTSAGRIPTAPGFRLYVERLNGDDRIRPNRLSSESRNRIDSSFAGVAGTQALLERTSHVLASLTSGVGIALAHVGAVDVLEHVHFSRLASRSVLAVVVMRSGMVLDRVLMLDKVMGPLELEAASNFLNQNFRGWSVERVRAEIQARVERERSEYQRLLASVEELWIRSVPAEQAVFVEGVLNLVTTPVAGQEDQSRLREMLIALEEKERVVDLLNAYVDARQNSVRVVFDLDEHAPAMQGLVLIAAPTLVNGEPHGAVGVIGPKRMHYENTMNAVGYLAQHFDRMLQRANGMDR